LEPIYTHGHKSVRSKDAQQFLGSNFLYFGSKPIKSLLNHQKRVVELLKEREFLENKGGEDSVCGERYP